MSDETTDTGYIKELTFSEEDSSGNVTKTITESFLIDDFKNISGTIGSNTYNLEDIVKLVLKMANERGYSTVITNDDLNSGLTKPKYSKFSIIVDTSTESNQNGGAETT